MLFNSLKFCVFFLIVFFAYYLLRKNYKKQNILLVTASAIFYASWNWKFLFLLIAVVFLGYFTAHAIHKSSDSGKKDFFLYVGITCSLLILGFFKYSKNIILPIGLSFYTFQNIGYMIDVYRKTVSPVNKILDFALFIMFFPQLLSGPIERAKHMIPQISNPRVITITNIMEGVFLIFWGLFQKIFVADNLAKLVDPIFALNIIDNGLLIIVGLIAFSFQILCDFAGYSDMARGIARCMGFDLMVNFNVPFLSKSPTELWQRWHISLSSWIRDYLYLPLVLKSGRSFLSICIVTLFTMIIMGLWHGPRATFVLWGVYWGTLIIIYNIYKKYFGHIVFSANKIINMIIGCVQTVFCFALIVLGALFFRANTIYQIGSTFTSLFNPYKFDLTVRGTIIQMCFYIFVFCGIQVLQYVKNDQLALLKTKFIFKMPIILLMIFLMLILGDMSAVKFIYAQF